MLPASLTIATLSRMSVDVLRLIAYPLLLNTAEDLDSHDQQVLVNAPAQSIRSTIGNARLWQPRRRAGKECLRADAARVAPTRAAGTRIDKGLPARDWQRRDWLRANGGAVSTHAQDSDAAFLRRGNADSVGRRFLARCRRRPARGG